MCLLSEAIVSVQVDLFGRAWLQTWRGTRLAMARLAVLPGDRRSKPLAPLLLHGCVWAHTLCRLRDTLALLETKQCLLVFTHGLASTWKVFTHGLLVACNVFTRERVLAREKCSLTGLSEHVSSCDLASARHLSLFVCAQTVASPVTTKMNTLSWT